MADSSAGWRKFFNINKRKVQYDEDSDGIGRPGSGCGDVGSVCR